MGDCTCDPYETDSDCPLHGPNTIQDQAETIRELEEKVCELEVALASPARDRIKELESAIREALPVLTSMEGRHPVFGAKLARLRAAVEGGE